jgi:hypothetical protein
MPTFVTGGGTTGVAVADIKGLSPYGTNAVPFELGTVPDGVSVFGDAYSTGCWPWV